jgi:hypothetical protein
MFLLGVIVIGFFFLESGRFYVRVLGSFWFL